MPSSQTQTGLPRLERWLAGVPRGLDSYPEALAKGSLARSALEGQPRDALAATFPPELRALVAEPPMAGEWFPEAHLVALVHSIADARGMTDEQLFAWARARNRALFESPAYRILMAVVSPGSMVRFAARRWGNWHRGTTLEAGQISDEGVRLELRFPAGLFDPLALRIYAVVFEVALEMAHARLPRVSLEEARPGHATFLASW